MRAFQVRRIGDAPVMCDVKMPTPAPDEVLLKIAACGLNFADLLMADGTYQVTPKPPFTLGLELAGTVLSLGAQVASLRQGDRVAVFSGSGGLAEFGCFPAQRCIRLPDAMSYDVASAFQVAYGTSHLALRYRARLQAGETLLVLGAAGGVGLAAIEIGKLAGARVIAVARGSAKLAVARAAGADHLIDSASADIRAAVKALGGADVVFDPVGGAQFKAALRACKPEARILVIGFASGEVPSIPANIILVKNITVIGHYWGGFLGFNAKPLHDGLAELFDWYAQGRLHPHISHTLPLERAAEALDLLRSRQSTGKVVVTPRLASDGH